jgi:hypothetical protein
MFQSSPILQLAVQGEKVRPLGIDMSIESLSSKNFSTGMFYFLIFAILIFVAIAFLFMFKDKTQKLKRGEKILFAWILFGVVVAIAMGAVQMMHGFLI